MAAKHLGRLILNQSRSCRISSLQNIVFLNNDIQLLSIRYKYGAVRNFSTTTNLCVGWGSRGSQEEIDKKEKQLIVKQGNLFDQTAQQAEKNKVTYRKAVLMYLHREKQHHRGHVEFIYAAMRRMEEFGVHKDIQSYKMLLHCFPKGKMVPKNPWQVEMMHYPKQQNCALDILQKMEDNGVIPDDDMGRILVEVFGIDGFPMRKYKRMMYWLPKFRNASPWKLPRELPQDPTELARLALKQMSVDLQTKISIYQTTDLEDSFDKTWIASAQSRTQQQLIEQHPTNKPLFVEGGYYMWLKEQPLLYFALRADADIRNAVEQETKMKERLEKNLFDEWKIFWDGKTEPNYEITLAPTIHDQENGTFLAMCITGSSTKDSLVSWIKFLQHTNPKLADISVVFALRTPETGLDVVKETNEIASI